MEYLNKKNHYFFQAGYSLVEMLLAIGLFGVLVTTLFVGFISTREGRPQQNQRYIATNLFQETLEALRVVREQGWEYVETNGTYYPAKTATSWELISGTEVIDLNSGLTRWIEIGDVYRDVNGEIVSSGGTIDPSTKAVTLTISWNSPLVSSYSTTIYLARLDNLALEYTTDTDFNTPGAIATAVSYVVNDDGEVVLEEIGPGVGNWCNPDSNTVSDLDLPKSGTARAITAVEGKVFSGTGENASGVSLAYVTVDNGNPPLTTLAGTFDGYKTNDVFGTDAYGYLATDTNNSEVVIVDLSDPMSQVGFYDIPGNQDADAIYVLNDIGFVAGGSTLYTFDLSSINGGSSQTGLGSISLSGTISSIFVVGDYAYISIDASTNQLQIIDVSNPSSLAVVGILSLDASGAVKVFGSSNGSRAYVATRGNATKNEFFLINVETKTAPSLISSYDTNGMDPKSIAEVSEGNIGIIVGAGAEEYQVVTMVPETNIQRCGGYNEDTGIYDLDTVLESDSDAYAYINTGNANAELKVIEGGPGGSGGSGGGGGSYSPNGIYESAVFDAGRSTAFNRFMYTGTTPADTSLSFQVAGAPAISGSCSGVNYTFVGPDGTDATFFTDQISAIPTDAIAGGYDNPAQCFKFRAYLDTTNIFYTPVLEDVTINYAP